MNEWEQAVSHLVDHLPHITEIVQTTGTSTHGFSAMEGVARSD